MPREVLDTQSLRLRSRRGAKKAIGAVAASLLIAAYHMLKDGTLYQDLGSNHFDNRAKRQASSTTHQPSAKPRFRRPDHPCGRVGQVLFLVSAQEVLVWEASQKSTHSAC